MGPVTWSSKYSTSNSGPHTNANAWLQREEKFFSKEVTHVVTSRLIPLDSDSKDATDPVTPSSTSTNSYSTVQPRTINPSLLDRQPESQGLNSRSKFTFEAPVSKRAPVNAIRDLESGKPNPGNADILHRAKEMGMKIWHLEKLQRIMNTMSNIPNDTQTLVGNITRTRAAFATGKGEREADLSRMLRNERLNGPSDRDATTALSELIPFKGCYIYIRDMDERSKPIMVRDYPKPAHSESGEWPQFHSVSLGKCPFVEEPPNVKTREEERRARDRAQPREAPRTRAATVREGAEAESTKTSALRGPLEETKNRANIAAPPSLNMPTPAFCPPPTAATAMPGSPSKTSRDAATHPRPKLFGGEPAASGMQPSNITSAIRSQMISSTAAAPGAKAGTSKEVHGLKRKVLEKNSGPALIHIHTRQRSIDSVCDGRAERNIPTVRQTRRQAQEALVHIDEESTQSEEDEDVWLAEDKRRKKQGQEKVIEAKDQKPGYCENCREKYDDFDDVSVVVSSFVEISNVNFQHIVGRKHRKFALTPENWKELDQLLSHLGRRLKEQDSDGF